MMATTQVSRKRKAYSILEKLQVVERIRKGEMQTKVSKEVGIPESTLRGWLKDEAKLREASTVLEDCGQARKWARTTQDQQLETAVFTWFTQARSEGTPLSGPVIQAQALKMHKELRGDEENFRANAGWLQRFKERHAISQVDIRGEQRSADEEVAASYPAKLSEIIAEGGFTGDQIYNCDETGLYYKMLPDKTLAAKSDENKTLGFKQYKDRITVLLCCNKTGSHKLAPLVIGKFGKPRCLHHVNMKTLPALYSHSKNAWMTAAIFEDWFHEEFVPKVRRHLRLKKLEPKAILLMDHCPAHPGVESLTSIDRKIKAVFLQKNTTSKLQPLDQGIISTLKRNYRRNLIVSMVDSSITVSDYLRQLNIKEAIHLVGEAWKGVTEKTIRGCWRKGLGAAFDNEEADSDTSFDGFDVQDLIDAECRQADYDNFSDTDVQQAQRVLGTEVDATAMEAWLTVDDDKPTYKMMTDDEIIQSVRQETETNSQTDTLEDDDEIVYDPPPTATEAIKGIEVTLRWLESSECATAAKVAHLRNLLHDAKADARKRSAQRKMTDFFTRK